MPTPTKTHSMPDKRIFSLKAAADYLGIGVTKFNQLRRAGEIAGKRHGRLVFFSRDELDRYFDSLPADEPGN